MTSTQFASYIRKRTKTNSTTFSDADILLFANINKDHLVSLIEKADEDYFGAELTRDLEADVRKYGIPPYVLRGITKVTAKLDGTNVVQLGKIVYDSYGQSTVEADIRAHMAGKVPAFTIFGKEIILLTENEIDLVTLGLKIYATVYPADLTALNGAVDMAANPSTVTLGMPRQLHKVWADMVVVDFKNSKEKPLPLSRTEQNLSETIALAINALVPLDTGGAFIASTGKRDTGEDY